MADYSFSFMDTDKCFEPAWMAPEQLSSPSRLIDKRSCDMWSFGVVLWELNTSQIPFEEYLPTECGRLESSNLFNQSILN